VLKLTDKIAPEPVWLRRISCEVAGRTVDIGLETPEGKFADDMNIAEGSDAVRGVCICADM
jgi:hypothetical protein